MLIPFEFMSAGSQRATCAQFFGNRTTCSCVTPVLGDIDPRGGEMPEPVRCDICGKIFSSRHVKSNQGLAHAKAGSTDEQTSIKRILEAYKTLSAENKKRVLAQLAALE